MDTEAIEELPNARIEEYGWGIGIIPLIRRKLGRKLLGPFEEIQVQPDGTILGIHSYEDRSKIEQVVLPNGMYTDRYHEISFLGDSQRMIARWGAFAYILSEKTGRPLTRRNYNEITPIKDGLYYATFGALSYILNENGNISASKKVAMPWKKRRKGVDLNHLLGPLKNTDFI